MHTLESIIAELEAQNHRGRVRCLREIRDKLQRYFCIMGKIANAFSVKDKRIAQLEAQLASCIPADSSDKSALAGVDDEGNPITPSPVVPTAEELAGQLKTSADALNGALANQ